jgi:hypothetical protein
MRQATRKVFTASSLALIGIVLCAVVILGSYLLSAPDCSEITASSSKGPIYPLLTKIGESDVTVTGNRHLKPGQMFVVEGDGRWFSNTTLLAVTDDEAVFLLEYYNYIEEDSSFCIWYASKQEFNR